MRIYISILLISLLTITKGLKAQSFEPNVVVPDSIIQDEEKKIIRGDKLKSFSILDNVTILTQKEIPDTVTTGNYNIISPEGRSISMGYLGNTNSPWINFLYFGRSSVAPDFIYLNGYDKLYWNLSNIRWYDTKTPFSLLRYNKNFDSQNTESVLQGKIGSNFTKKVNITVGFNYINADGFYTSNKSRTIGYGLSGYYRGDRYKVYAFIGNNNFVQSENGGITDFRYISNPQQFANGRIDISSREVPVRIPNETLFNRVVNGLGFVSQSYSLGFWQTHIKVHQDKKNLKKRTLNDLFNSDEINTDSIKMDTIKTFVSFMDISHNLSINKQFHRMISHNRDIDWKKIFGKAYINRTPISGLKSYNIMPNDTASLLSVKNTIALTINEGFRPWVKFGLSVYSRIENNWVSQIDTINNSYKNNANYNSLFVGGRIDKNKGNGLKFNTKGEIGIIGRSLGAINIEGNISGYFNLFNEKVSLGVNGSFHNNPAPYFAEHYHSTFGYWDKDFSFIRSIRLGGNIYLNKIGLTINANTSTLNNNLYWDKDAEVKQYEGVIQILSIRARENVDLFKHLNILADISYQGNTNNNIIPLPTISARLNIYTHFYLARVLRVQLGLDSYWHTAFYAPYWNPSTMQFQNQTQNKIGGKTPLMIAYANFRLKQGRFFVKMFNIGELIFDPDRMSLDKYPYNPSHIEAGIIVDLFN